VLKLYNALFGALAGARFFFGFRPRLLGICDITMHTCLASRVNPPLTR
jgi:hypothetical protein